ncbi:transglutaminase domain-containing protein [Blautia luti]|uniref:transglutaminase domain-containing protein n=1 Tax=Blautia luti TaxID=89014 RepID=UPI0018AB4A89|nr:transglutaminase domain-containing protein [Blautia luti]
MKKFTKWLAVCAACLALGAVPAAGATTSVQPTVAQASVKTTKPAPKPRRGWYGTMPKKCYYGKDGQTLKGLHKIKGEYYYFGQIKGYMKTGWKNIVRNGKMRRHYFSPKTGKACIGLHKIDGKYYFFNKYGIMKIVNTVDGKTTYYIGSDGVIQARKKGNTMYYANGKTKMNQTAYEYETLLRAKAVVAAITTPGMSQSEKFQTCYNWVIKHYYNTRRIFQNQTSWPALYANDYFLTGSQGGDCFSDSCTFAYLARALGYKNVYVCVDTDLFDDSGHCWAEINGLVYDPLFSEAKNYYKYFGATYASYGLSPIRRVRVN